MHDVPHPAGFGQLDGLAVRPDGFAVAAAPEAVGQQRDEAPAAALGGQVAVALAVLLLIIPAVMPADAAALASQNVQWLIGALFVGGLGGVVWQGKP